MKKYAIMFAAAAAAKYGSDAEQRATIVPRAVAAYNAARGIKAEFKPGPGVNKGKIEIHREKRIKSQDADVSANAGDRIIARLNAAKKRDWDTVEVLPTVKRDFLVNEEVGDASNFSTNPGDFQNGAEETMDHVLIQDEETAIAKILASPAVVKVSLGDQSAADLETLGEKVFDELALQETDISQLVDDFVHMSSSTMHLSKYAAKALKAYKGTMFNVDSSRYADDIVPNFTFTNSEPGMVNSHFDKFEVDQSQAQDGSQMEKVVAIIMKDDAYYDSGYTNGMTPLDTTLLDELFQGHSYYKANAVIDPARIVVLTAATKTKVVKKVND